MPTEPPPSDKEQRRRSAAGLFLKVHDLSVGSASEMGPPVTRLCNLIISEALLTGSDGVRVGAPTTEGAQVQFHRAGAWVDVMRVPAPIQAPIVNRLKVMANLDVAKHPTQEGSLKVRLQGEVLSLGIMVTLRGTAEEASLTLPPRSGEASVSNREDR
jgi:type II secretory ATPase GspE/PulE/Tfp pilus assembly ATPase PilB-like protein